MSGQRHKRPPLSGQRHKRPPLPSPAAPPPTKLPEHLEIHHYEGSCPSPFGPYIDPQTTPLNLSELRDTAREEQDGAPVYSCLSPNTKLPPLIDDASLSALHTTFKVVEARWRAGDGVKANGSAAPPRGRRRRTLRLATGGHVLAPRRSQAVVSQWVVDREPFSVVAQEALHTWSAQRRAQSATMAAADDAVSEGGGDGDGDGDEGGTDEGQDNEDTGMESPHETRRHEQTHQRHSFFQSFREMKISSLRETSQRLSPALALANVGGGTVNEQEDGDGDNEEQPQHHPRAKSVFEKIFLRVDGSKFAVRCEDSSSSDGISDRSSSGDDDDDEDPGSEGRREDGVLIERYPNDHHDHHKHRHHHHHHHSPDDPSSHMPPRDRDFHGAYLRACQVRYKVLLWSERVTEGGCSSQYVRVGPKLKLALSLPPLSLPCLLVMLGSTTVSSVPAFQDSISPPCPPTRSEIHHLVSH